MNAGKLRHRVAFDEPVTSQNGTGEEIVTWTVNCVLWATVEPLNGRERLQANQVLAEGDTRIRIRWSTWADAINAKWRARHQGVIYNIVSVAHVNAGHREIEIMATSGLNAG